MRITFILFEIPLLSIISLTPSWFLHVFSFIDIVLQGARYKTHQHGPCPQAGHILAGKTTSHHLVVQIRFGNLYALQMPFTNTEF